VRVDCGNLRERVAAARRNSHSIMEGGHCNSRSTPVAEIIGLNGCNYHKIDKILGCGATSEVYLGMQDDGSLVALKFVKLPEETEGQDGSPISRGRCRKV